MAKDQISEGQPKLKRKEYEKELQRLQAELCNLQDWVKLKGLRIIVVFEGRDGAGKGGTLDLGRRAIHIDLRARLLLEQISAAREHDVGHFQVCLC